jgi:dTDP-4-dehydrorhamnose 3,5-epimerase-like enzyme
MPFTFERGAIDGLVVVKPKLFGDERGFFMEVYVAKEFRNAGIDMNIVQINHSRSSKGVLRGDNGCCGRHQEGFAHLWQAFLVESFGIK